jgi:hypothetical protein
MPSASTGKAVEFVKREEDRKEGETRVVFVRRLHRGCAMDNWQLVLAGVFGLVVLLLYVFSLVWVTEDAALRGKSGGLTALLVAVTWPVGLLAWLVWRPKVGGGSA